MRPIDLSPLYRSTVGFDRLFDLIDSVTGADQAATGYPPYNIERLGENEYRITMAVAGFSQDELRVDVKEQVLTVTGAKKALTINIASKDPAGLPVPVLMQASDDPTVLATAVDITGSAQ